MKWWVIVAALALGAAACSPRPASPTKQPASLVVGAAADLQFAFEEIDPLFERETGAKVEFTFGSSGNLARQIENGAPIDVFASADEAYVSELEAKRLILENTRRLYALGRLALIVNRAAGLELRRLEELLSSRVKHVSIANPDHAPYGRAARQALEKAGIWGQLQPKVVYGENVRQALQFVQTGNSEAGIVALSVASVPEVTYTLVDQSLYSPLRQEMAAIRGTKQEATARQFISFVNGPQGAPIMKKYGFTPPAGP